jgi:hypothetical protein
MRLPRPHVPVAVKIAVAERQLDAALRGNETRWRWMMAGAPMTADRNRYLRFLLVNLLGDAPWQLDHDPPLAARVRTRTGDYRPPASDADYLVWRTIEDHDRKTRLRGDHGQFSDLALIRREKRRKRRRPAPRSRWPKRKLQSRPMRRAPP